MNNNFEKATLEIIAPTPEDAIEKGLSQLGLPEEAVDIEVLDDGSRGLFGIGGRQARVRLTIKAPDGESPIDPPPNQDAVPSVPPLSQVPIQQESVIDDENKEDKAIRIAGEVVQELLAKMKINAEVSTSYIEPEDSRDEQAILIDIQGNDLSILIGRRSETLNALQYITSIIVNKQMNGLVPLTIDVQGYRSRRERQLRQLARRMADQAVQTNRRQVLEPMPPNERRLIHLELRNDEKIITESFGEGASRKVTISPKE